MHARAAQNIVLWNRRRLWLDNDKTYAEGKVCAGKKSGMEGAAAGRAVNVETSTATATATTAATKIATVAAP